MTAARLPTSIEAGAEGGPVDVRNHHKGKDGKIQRVLELDHPLGQWDIGYGIWDISDYQAARDLWRTHRTVRAFRFYAPAEDDHSVTGQVLGTGNGSNTDFDFVRTWTSGSYSYSKDIFALVNDTATLYLNGVAVSSSDWTLIKPAAVSGVHQPVLARFDVAPGNGVVVTADFDWDTPVVFTNERLRQTVEPNDVGRLRGINVNEVLENPDL